MAEGLERAKKVSGASERRGGGRTGQVEGIIRVEGGVEQWEPPH